MEAARHCTRPSHSVWPQICAVFRFLIQLYARGVETVFLATWTMGIATLCLCGAALAFWLVAMGVAAVLHR
jgi:hypothetical protein